MGETIQDTVHVIGTGAYEYVDCERFRVDGTATVDGDAFAAVASVNGTATVGGRLDAGEVDADGSVTVAGDVRAETVTVDGAGEFRGDVGADRLAADGTARIGGDASVDHIDADGSTAVGGNLDGHEVQSDGSLTVDGNVVAARAAFDGSVAVEGLTDVTELAVDGSGTFGDVNADAVTVEGRLRAGEVAARTFEFTVQGDSEADAVEGTEITVRRGEEGSSLLEGILDPGDPAFEVDTVSGEVVDLDAVRADVVAGERVVLGPDAEVGVVYADDLDADDGASVGDVRAYEDY